jgi:hypothetical protein
LVDPLKSGIIALRTPSSSLEEWWYCTREPYTHPLKSDDNTLERPHNHYLQSSVIALGRLQIHHFQWKLCNRTREASDPSLPKIVQSY